MGERQRRLEQWLNKTAVVPGFQLTLASGDASFRRYFRVSVNGDSFIAMDAPPQQEDCRPFIAISRAMFESGLHVPQVLEMDLEQGFLLLTDLGDQQYLDILNKNTVQRLYTDAMQALLTMQKTQPPAGLLSDYSAELLNNEMGLFRDWFINAYLGLTLSSEQQAIMNNAFELLTQQALVQPQVWVHRDYHSRNLMWVDEKDARNLDAQQVLVNPGILDFQDAVIGPVCYDLVSLLRDCYINWPRQQVRAWVEQYRSELIDAGLISEDVSVGEFQRWFDWMGVQRHLKAIGIFARLNLRDNKPGYLADIPRTLLYVLQVCRDYQELRPLSDWLQQSVVPLVAEFLSVNDGIFEDN